MMDSDIVFSLVFQPTCHEFGRALMVGTVVGSLTSEVPSSMPALPRFKYLCDLL